MRRLAILGASGHGKVVGDAALLAGFEVVEFFDERWPTLGAVGPWRVVGTTADLLRAGRDYDGFVVAIGDNRTRLARHASCLGVGLTAATVVHPAAVVSPFARIGAGCVVFAGAVINPFAVLGEACIVNTGATIDHDCVLAAGVHVSPGAHLAGAVNVGEATWIGIGAVVRQGIEIGADVLVGAGAAVVSHVAAGLTVLGVPARPTDVAP